MKAKLSKKAEKAYIKLPLNLKRKFNKQLGFLKDNMYHPSLYTKRLQGTHFFEARIDFHNRFIFTKENEYYEIITLGPHDTGLGKK